MIDPGVKARLLLCDAAQVQGGKLYILGGGWSRVVGLGPLTFTLAVSLLIPWHMANKPISVDLTLVDDNGRVLHAPSGQAVSISGKLEVGRPPGLRQGSLLENQLTVPVANLLLEPGVYRWDLTIDGELREQVVFEVVEAPPGLADALRSAAE